MLSMSGGWFFVVASEAVTVGNTTFALPGIGSYVATALEARDLKAIFYAILAMLVVILLYDQLIFRPLVAWSDKFRFETTASITAPEPWMLKLLRRTRLFRGLSEAVGTVVSNIFRLRLGRSAMVQQDENQAPSKLLDRLWYVVIAVLALYAAWQVVGFVSTTLHWRDFATALLMGLYTMTRVVVLMALAALIWVPIGVWIGLRPKLAELIQPLAQFLAAFPANLAFPVFVVVIVRYGLNANVWLSPLMILGTQWYILFNVIAGASAFPSDLREAAGSFHLGGWRWWVKVILPGIFPYYITGAITASGGSWNASIVAEVASWGDTHLTATGLGAYIADATEAGDFPRVVLGITVMCILVTLFNRLLWRPLYAFGERRLRLG
jgi:NitT/TauT family transport system permease protein